MKHSVLELILALTSILNIICGCLLYRKDCNQGITVETGTRRKAIMTCTSMCIVSGTLALLLYGMEYASPHN